MSMPRHPVVTAIVAAVLAVGSGAASAHSDDSVLAPASPAEYQELSARWWQWAASTPFSAQGPFGQAGTDCSQSQPAGHTWFLAGQFTDLPAERTCTIPAGTLLFLPLINVECSSLEGPPFQGDTPAQRRACVQKADFDMIPLAAELDGEPITAHLPTRTVISPDFRIRAVDGNPASIPTGSGFSTSKGIWLLLAPLSPGKHLLHFAGAIPAFNFAPEATYHLTVSRPARHGR